MCDYVLLPISQTTVFSLGGEQTIFLIDNGQCTCIAGASVEATTLAEEIGAGIGAMALPTGFSLEQ